MPGSAARAWQTLLPFAGNPCGHGPGEATNTPEKRNGGSIAGFDPLRPWSDRYNMPEYDLE